MPVSATSELYFGEVKTLEDGSKIVPFMVKDVNDLGSCDAIIEFTKSGVNVTTHVLQYHTRIHSFHP